MNYAQIKEYDVANGPGIRVSLFVSGCTHHCKGCFNSVTWDFSYGSAYTQKTEDKVMNALSSDYIRGLSILGGEPFEPQNLPSILPLVRHVRHTYPKKTIWCYTGYKFDDDIMKKMIDVRPEVRPFLECMDIIVDGEFVEEKKNLRLKFRGSENQRIIDVRASLESGKVVSIPDDRI